MDVSQLVDPAAVAAESKVTESQAAVIIARVLDILVQAADEPGGVSLQGRTIKMATAVSRKVRKRKAAGAVAGTPAERVAKVRIDAQLKGFAAKAETSRTKGKTVDRRYLVEHLGGFGSALFDRLDQRYRSGDQVATLNVREVREALSNARLPGHGAIVRPRRSGDDEDGEEFLVISLADITDAYSASENDIDWVDAFAPSVGLPAAEGELKLRRGAPGRRLKL